MTLDTLGAAIAARRRLLQLTQGRVADLAGIGRRTVSDLETGRGTRGTTLSSVLQICRVLGLDLLVRDAAEESRDV